MSREEEGKYCLTLFLIKSEAKSEAEEATLQ